MYGSWQRCRADSMAAGDGNDEEQWKWKWLRAKLPVVSMKVCDVTSVRLHEGHWISAVVWSGLEGTRR